MPERQVVPTSAIGFADLCGMSREELTAKLAGPPEAAARLLHAAARFGFVEAQAALGQILLDGRGVPRDRCAAVNWFRIAAEAGYVPAINMLGRCCELGWGMPIDLPRAADCYRQAAAAGLDWGQYNFANMLLRGRGRDGDRKKALALYRLAAEQNHAKSINMVGRFIEEGWEMPADPRAAIGWYYRAAEGGDFRGQYNLASALAARGDVAAAETWLHRAMENSTVEFLDLMSSRLAKSPDPRLRRAGMRAAALGAVRSAQRQEQERGRNDRQRPPVRCHALSGS